MVEVAKNNEIIGMTNEEIDLIDLFKILIRNKVLIVGIAVLVFIVSCVGAVVVDRSSKSARAIIGYNYDGISAGKSPDGSAFSSSEIVDSIILNRVYRRYPILKREGFTTKDIVAGVEITGITPNDISKVAEVSLKRGEKFMYTPSDYVVTLKLTGDNELDRNILNTLLTEYTDYFAFKYNNNTVFPKMELDKLGGYDYVDRVAIVRESVIQIMRSAQGLSGRGFISKQIGYSYEDIARFLKSVEEIDLGNVSSRIAIENVTNDPFGRELVLKNQIRELELERKRLMGTSEVLERMLKEYKPEGTQVLLPSLGEGLKISTEEDYYTDLLDRYREANTKIMEINVDIKERERVLSEIRAVSDAALDTVRKNIEETINKLNNIIDDVNIMNLEYTNQYYSDQIRVISPAETVGGSKSKFIVVMGLVMGLILGSMAAFLREFWKHLKEK
ncbi:hypothetical protein PM10SUCC1_20840 [Propionigenium maris DSM 9537]|uniref:Polysaccharide chain length determinant N-terminal domain-containing protein n=1 Tax=Propionigenium maris DSM 9537 TaxID=1123000 RepID=A0A9W6LP42_9FUSO|nr:Wzz/FepE/Etk N-terminal domain-containing protein [Propionigenium maris]GLI56570.1 hypothetical protein PM10SUCC1_20840 [Propionigenium maris DSM 9537]